MADFDKVIPPGKEGKIDVTIHGHKIHPGQFKKSYTVTTNDPESKKVILNVAGVVKKVFDLSSDLSIAGFRDEELKMETIITNRLETPIRLSGYRLAEIGKNSPRLEDKVGIKLEEIEEGRKYRLKVWNTKELEPGHYIGELFLATDFEKLKEKKIRIRMTVAPDVEVHPRSIIMREMMVPEGTSKFFDKPITIIAARGDSLKLLQVIPDREDITVSTKEVHPGKSFRCTVRLRPPSKTGKYMGSIKIVTNYPGYEELEVRITGTVRVVKEKKK